MLKSTSGAIDLVPAAPRAVPSTAAPHVAIPVHVIILVRIATADVLRVSRAVTHSRPDPAIIWRRTAAHHARRGGGSEGRHPHLLRIHHVLLVRRSVHPLGTVRRPRKDLLHLRVMETSRRRTLVSTSAGWRRRRTHTSLWLHLTVVIAGVAPGRADAVGSHLLHILWLLLLLMLLLLLLLLLLRLLLQRGGSFRRFPRVDRRAVLLSCLRWTPTLVLRGHRRHGLLPIRRWILLPHL